MNEIFLSASVPLKGRKYFEGSDPLLIHAAVRAFAMLVLGRRHIVWGGHPSITPMMWAACESLGVEYAKCVTLYQSSFFRDFFPEENKGFRNVRYVDKQDDLASSLWMLRMEMFKRPNFEAAVFIGGMEGVEDEYSLFRKLHGDKTCLLVSSPGGAAAVLAARLDDRSDQDRNSTNFTKLYIEKLGISPSDKRSLD